MRRPIRTACKPSRRYPKGVKWSGAVEYRGRQRWVGTFATEGEWEERALEVARELRRDHGASGAARARPPAPTVAEYLGVRVDESGRVVPREPGEPIWPWTRPRRTTKDSSRRTLAENVRWFARRYGDRRVDTFGRSEALDIAARMTDGQKAAVRRLFSDLEDEELVETNKFVRTMVKRRPRIEIEGFRLVTEEELRRLLDCALASRTDDYRHTIHALILTEATVGMRPGEIFGLEHRQIDFAAGLIELENNIDDRGAVTLPKGNRPRLAPLTAEMAAAYRNAPALSDRWLLPAPRGGVLTQSLFDRYWNPVRTAAGMPDLQFYELKHRAITHMCTPAPHGLGMDPADVALLVGHNDNGETMRRYYLKLDQRQAVERYHAAAARRPAAGRRLRVIE